MSTSISLLARRGGIALLVTAAIVGAVACSDGTEDGSSTPSASTSTDATTPTTQPASTTAPTTTAPATTVDPSTFVPIELPPADWDGLEEWTLPALGGVTFGVPDGSAVHHQGDMVMVHAATPDAGRYEPSMVVAHISQGPLTFVVDTDDVIEFAKAPGVGTVAPSGTTLDLLGLQFTGYDFEADASSDIGPHYLFPADRPPLEYPTWWQPFPRSRLYLADTDAGVMVVGAIGTDQSTLDDATAVFERVAPTIEWSGSIKKPITPVSHPLSDGISPPTPMPIPAGWPDELTGAFQPLAPMEYATASLVTPMRFTSPDGWWVQSNFIGWLTLTADESFGPGDRGIDFRLKVDRIAPLSRDFEMIGDPIEIVPGEAWPADQLATLEIGDVTEVIVGGLAARTFDVRIADDATCDDDSPCEYVLFAPPSFPPVSIRKGYSVRIWDVYGVDEPILITAADDTPAFLDEASMLIDDVEFAAG